MVAKKTAHRLIGTDAHSALEPFLRQHFGQPSLMIVCDDTTWNAAGNSIHAMLASAAYHITPYSVGRNGRATLEASNKLAHAAAPHDLLLSVGSGTINDITKYAAHQAKKPYISIATAASMNGYTSATSSLEERGFKHSFAGTPPIAVVADTAILSAAPKRMTRAGLGDTLCRSSVECDMLLSHYLLDTPYPRTLFDRLRAHEAKLISDAGEARTGAAPFVTSLMHALLDAGDAMTEYGSSAVSSQGEHMIAHTLEMLFGAELRNIMHGEMVALTTLTVTKLQQKMLLSQPIVKSMPREHAQFERLFGKKISGALYEQYQKKLMNAEQAAEVNQRILTTWPEIKAALVAVISSVNTLERAFIHSGLAVRAKDIGLDDERYRSACANAYLTRDRFSFLDLAAMNDRRAE